MELEAKVKWGVGQGCVCDNEQCTHTIRFLSVCV